MDNRNTRLMTALQDIYGDAPSELDRQKARYGRLIDPFGAAFGWEPEMAFSTPGRTEISGNHTDHNHGRVLAASVNLDSIAVAAPVADATVTLYSEGYPEPFVVALADLSPREDEKETTHALIRGIAARLDALGHRIGGFAACMSSEVFPGSGLSSSASVEVLIGSIFNALYNRAAIPVETLAAIGQFAENRYFGKACGLMDQLACAVGGIIGIDFGIPGEPRIEPVEVDFARYGFRALIVNTGGSHADLSDNYSAVPAEMMAVARELGKTVCREITPKELMANISRLRGRVGDRAILRAHHFLGEDQRVADQIAALQNDDFDRFLALVRASGDSSFKWLQNIYPDQHAGEQGVALGLALSEDAIAAAGAGACRIHGGGFAGTIQVLLPEEAVADYVPRMEAVFGEGCVLELSVRHTGAVHFAI